jgi:hypothetical protein
MLDGSSGVINGSSSGFIGGGLIGGASVLSGSDSSSSGVKPRSVAAAVVVEKERAGSAKVSGTVRRSSNRVQESNVVDIAIKRGGGSTATSLNPDTQLDVRECDPNDMPVDEDEEVATTRRMPLYELAFEIECGATVGSAAAAAVADSSGDVDIFVPSYELNQVHVLRLSERRDVDECDKEVAYRLLDANPMATNLSATS